ncbi:WD40/YVTN/BNR-like repeat-containing protein [Angustibacter sp. McL0619]|uniref:WD40/YVTN/BNR-like repeat-containing protein n=1 Tax=Angustibacter sp. McL0619 TaxID=3415676 RepID=UPI003CE8E633
MTARNVLRPLTVVATASALAVPAPLLSAETAAASPQHEHGNHLQWKDLPTGSTARLRGLAPVNHDVAWVSGTLGTVLRTDDGGRTWDDVSPGGDTGALQFRDIEAFDAHRAVILSIGEGGDSRIYRTSDGGHSWHLGFTNDDPAAFYDCMSFWDDRHGLAMSDPVDGKFRVLSTRNGGRSWSVVDPSGMPPALDGEFAFAASGTCLVTAGTKDAWIATGGGAQSRVLRTHDHGLTWKAATTTIPSDPAAGIFSLAVRGTDDLVAVGGTLDDPTIGTDFSARSWDGGRRFWPGGDLGGYRSGSSWLTHSRNSVVAVGPTGSDVSLDGGRHWRTFDTSSLDSVECTKDGACWASGEAGRVAVLRGSAAHH